MFRVEFWLLYTAHIAVMLLILNWLIHFTEYPVLLLNSTGALLLC